MSNLAGMLLLENHEMLQNASDTASIVSELLRKNQQENRQGKPTGKPTGKTKNILLTQPD